MVDTGSRKRSDDDAESAKCMSGQSGRLASVSPDCLPIFGNCHEWQQM